MTTNKNNRTLQMKVLYAVWYFVFVYGINIKFIYSEQDDGGKKIETICRLFMLSVVSYVTQCLVFHSVWRDRVRKFYCIIWQHLLHNFIFYHDSLYLFFYIVWAFIYLMPCLFALAVVLPSIYLIRSLLNVLCMSKINGCLLFFVSFMP